MINPTGYIPRDPEALALAPAPKPARPAEAPKEATPREAAPELPQGARGGPAEALAQAIARLEPNFLPDSSRLSIARDESTQKIVYRSIDPATGEVLRQWPSEEILRVLGNLRALEGLMVDEQA